MKARESFSPLAGGSHLASGESDQPLVTIVVPAYQQEALLSRSLQNLAQQSRDSFSVVVVDDESPAALRRTSESKHVIFLRQEETRGPAAAINRGVKQTSAKYVILLNTDTFPSVDLVETLVRHMEAHPSCHFAAAKLVGTDSRLDGAGDALLVGGGSYRLGHRSEDNGDYAAPRPILSACAAGAIYQRSLFETVGSFDEDFFGYLDDIDFCLRAQLAGNSGMYVPGAVAAH